MRGRTVTGLFIAGSLPLCLQVYDCRHLGPLRVMADIWWSFLESAAINSQSQNDWGRKFFVFRKLEQHLRSSLRRHSLSPHMAASDMINIRAWSGFDGIFSVEIIFPPSDSPYLFSLVSQYLLSLSLSLLFSVILFSSIKDIFKQIQGQRERDEGKQLLGIKATLKITDLWPLKTGFSSWHWATAK